jgi:uncharacterized protein YndB with AHSA1/START domain
MDERQMHAVEIKAGVEAVWAEVTKLGLIHKPMFGTVLEAELRPGGRLLYRSQDGKRVIIIGEVLECDAPRRLVHTFRFTNLKDTPTRVEWTLDATPSGTRVTIVHSQFKDQQETYKGVLTSWPKILGDIAAVVETGDVPLGSRIRNALMNALMFMMPKSTLRENIDELKR